MNRFAEGIALIRKNAFKLSENDRKKVVLGAKQREIMEIRFWGSKSRKFGPPWRKCTKIRVLNLFGPLKGVRLFYKVNTISKLVWGIDWYLWICEILIISRDICGHECFWVAGKSMCWLFYGVLVRIWCSEGVFTGFWWFFKRFSTIFKRNFSLFEGILWFLGEHLAILGLERVCSARAKHAQSARRARA